MREGGAPLAENALGVALVEGDGDLGTLLAEGLRRRSKTMMGG